MGKFGYLMKRPVEAVSCTLGSKYFKRKMDKYFDFWFSGLEKIPAGPCVTIQNHVTNLDGLMFKAHVIGVLKRRTHLLVQSGGVYSSKYKLFLWSIGEIPVDVDERSTNKIVLKRTGEYLNLTHNHMVSIFAEGPTRDLIDKDGRPIPVEERTHYPGAARIAINNQVPIVPIGLSTTKEAEAESWNHGLADKKEGMRFLNEYVKEKGRIPYWTRVGEPILPDQVEGETKKEKTRWLTEVVRREVVRLYQKGA